jgi:hypothetical protein
VKKRRYKKYEWYQKICFGAMASNVPLNRDVAGIGTEFSRQDRKCFGNKTPGKLKTSNDRG